MLHDSAFLSFLVLWFIFIFLSEIFFICLLKSIFKLGQLNIHLHFNDSLLTTILVYGPLHLYKG